jgi:hypothetical protein
MAETDFLSGSSMDWLDALIKNYYTPMMIEAAKLRRYIINYLEKNRQTERIGKSAIVSVRLAWAESVAPGTSTSVLPAALDPEGTTMTVTTQHIRGLLHLWFTEQVYSDAEKKAFVSSAQEKLKGIAMALQAESEIYCYGDGGASPRCVCTDASNASGVVTLTCDSTRLLRRGMPVDFKESNGDAITNGTYVRVKHILSDTSFSVDVGSANGEAFASAAANAYVFHAGGKDSEPNGLESLIGTTSNTLYGINRTTAGNEWFIPLVKKIGTTGSLDAATGPSAIGTTLQPWELKYIHQILHTLTAQRQAPKEKLAIFTTDTILTKMVADNRALGVAMPLSKKVDVWPEETVEFGGVPVITSELSRAGAIFIPCLNTFTKYETAPFSWDTVGGMWKQVYDQSTARPLDAKQAYFREIYNLAVGDATQSAAIYDCEGAY